MLETIWGLKTVAIFDVWTFEHILAGMSIGSLVCGYHQKSYGNAHSSPLKNILKHMDYVTLLCLAYAWESLEHYLETGLAGNAVEHWFQGVEMWGNRLFSDPLMMLVGYHIIKKYPKWVLPGRILSALWLITHIFIFPHSMYLHEIF